MNTSFWKFKVSALSWAAVGLSVLSLLAGLVRQGMTPEALTGLLLAVLLSVLLFRALRDEQALIEKIQDMGKSIKQGDLQYRITAIPMHHQLAEVAWDLNDGRDQEEAFFKEVSSAF